MRVAVIGGGTITDEERVRALEVGRELGERGHTVVCGGRGGTMAAVCQGASEAGGTTIGILPSSDPGEANPYVDIAIATGLGHGRNALVPLNGDGVIALAGGAGTLTELGYALIYDVPVVGLETHDIDAAIETVTSPTAAVEALERAVNSSAMARSTTDEPETAVETHSLEGPYTLEPTAPSPAAFVGLREAAGMAPRSLEAATRGLPNSLFAVRVRHRPTDEVVAMGRIVGDDGAVYQISDMAVHPDHQGQGLGTAVMERLLEYLEETAPKTAYVNLIADVDGFYEQFDFAETRPTSKGMYRHID